MIQCLSFRHAAECVRARVCAFLYLGLRKKGEKLAGGAGHKREFSYIGGTDGVSRAQ